jgi:hypothetical protein
LNPFEPVDGIGIPMKKPLMIILGLASLLLALFSVTKLKRRDRVGL